MKNTFKFMAIAMLALGLTTSCKQKAEETPEIDTLNTEEMIVEQEAEQVEDTVVAEPAEPAEPVTKAPAKTKAKAKTTQNNAPTMNATNGSERNNQTTTSSSRIDSKVNSANARSKDLTSTGTKDEKNAGERKITRKL
jgi:hypothetical protein